MTDLICCAQCGTSLQQGTPICSTCGAVLDDQAPADTDPRMQQVCELFSLARQCQQDGDLATALRHAREALALRPDCCTTHTLLGHLYEQSGNSAAARYHFQAALQVAPADEAECVAPPAPVRRPLVAAPHGGWLTTVLVSCVLLSALAVLYAYWAETRRTDLADMASVFDGGQKNVQTGPEAPTWTWTAPKELATETAPVAVTAEPSASPTHETKTEPTTSNTNAAKDTGKVEAASPTPEPKTVLGPSARRAQVIPANATQEAADKAVFCADYERAAAIYEAIIAEQPSPDPHVYQDLAFCYQHLGNSPKADEYLALAITGYQAVLEKDPANAAAKQGLKSCQAARRALQGSRVIAENTTTP